MKTLLAFAILAATTGAAAGALTHEFSRYSVILQRQPFGAPPAAPPAPAASQEPAVPAEPPPFARQYRMCMITETATAGIRVGLVDLQTKQASFLRVGQDLDGLMLVDADFQREGAKLRKDGREYWIYLDGTTAAPGGGARRPNPFAAAAADTARRETAARPRPPSTDNKPPYAERLAKRREILEERRRRSREMEAIGPEALKTQLQEYQMELIRAGGELGPPLPIPLTREMDDQLVEEGVLPPQE